jgi:hypothetical protein
MNQLAQRYRDVADFVVIYIAEAHAQDEWPLGRRVCLNQHKTIEDRIAAAKYYTETFGCEFPVLVDTMENQFDREYAVWPERFFIISDRAYMSLVRRHRFI